MPADGEAPLRILIVEDHELLSQSVAMALRAEGYDVAVVHPEHEAQLMAAIARHRAEIVLLDLDLGPDVRPGEELVAALVAAGPRVLVVTGTEEVDRIAVAVQHGAEGFVHKSVGFEALLEAVLRMARGKKPTDQGDIRRLQQQVATQVEQRRQRLGAFDRLSAREREVLARLMAGDPVDVIAASSVVSVATVRSQVRGILTKLGVPSQLAAVALAHRLEWRHEG